MSLQASSQLMRTYLLVPRFCVFRSPSGSHRCASRGTDAVLNTCGACTQAERRRGLHARLECLAAPALKNPVVQLFFAVIVFEAHGANADELAVLHIRGDHVHRHRMPQDQGCGRRFCLKSSYDSIPPQFPHSFYRNVASSSHVPAQLCAYCLDGFSRPGAGKAGPMWRCLPGGIAAWY